jgi:hypothetical protein
MHEVLTWIPSTAKKKNEERGKDFKEKALAKVWRREGVYSENQEEFNVGVQGYPQEVCISLKHLFCAKHFS